MFYEGSRNMEISKFLNIIHSAFRSITGILIVTVTWLTMVAGVLFYLTTDSNFLGEGGMILIPLIPFLFSGGTLVGLTEAVFHLASKGPGKAEVAIASLLSMIVNPVIIWAACRLIRGIAGRLRRNH
jgi:hypothetical protein